MRYFILLILIFSVHDMLQNETIKYGNYFFKLCFFDFQTLLRAICGNLGQNMTDRMWPNLLNPNQLFNYIYMASPEWQHVSEKMWGGYTSNFLIFKCNIVIVTKALRGHPQMISPSPALKTVTSFTGSPS